MWKCLNLEPWEVLEHAASALDRFGWLQTEYGSVYRGFCALGAIMWTHRHHTIIVGSEDWRPEHSVARLELEVFLGVDHLPEWNDAPGRTRDEVTSAMRACAAIMRARGADDRAATALRATQLYRMLHARGTKRTLRALASLKTEDQVYWPHPVHIENGGAVHVSLI